MISIREETEIQGSEIIKPEAGRPSWKNRNKVIFATLLFCAFCIMYIMFSGTDTRVNESIVLGCFALAGSVIGVYVAGASWTDVSIEKIKLDGSRQSSNTPNRNVITHNESSSNNKEPEIINSLANGKGPEDNNDNGK